jgi:hypothetical protein
VYIGLGIRALQRPYPRFQLFDVATPQSISLPAAKIKKISTLPLGNPRRVILICAIVWIFPFSNTRAAGLFSIALRFTRATFVARDRNLSPLRPRVPAVAFRPASASVRRRVALGNCACSPFGGIGRLQLAGLMLLLLLVNRLVHVDGVPFLWDPLWWRYCCHPATRLVSGIVFMLRKQSRGYLGQIFRRYVALRT